MATCPYFGRCGGCSLQDRDYPQQLKIKTQRLLTYFKYYGLLNNVGEIYDCLPSPQLWHYRNKMEFSFSMEKDSLILGLHKKSSKNEVLDIEKCPIFSEEAMGVARRILEFFRKKNLTAYDSFKRQGFLRHLVLREGKFTQELLVNVVSTSMKDLPPRDFQDFLKSITGDGYVKSAIWTSNDSFSDAVVSQRQFLLEGRNFIYEELGNIRFRIYPQSFFQTNPKGVQLFYEKIKELVLSKKPRRILDLYAGCGPISLYIADSAERVVAVEVIKEAIENAGENARINRIENVEFVCADARKFLYERRNQLLGIELVIINPPRQGVSKKVLKRVLDIRPRHILYLSCNPQTLAENLSWIKHSPYKIKFIQPLDLFPHTSHIESLVYLIPNGH